MLQRQERTITYRERVNIDYITSAPKNTVRMSVHGTGRRYITETPLNKKRRKSQSKQKPNPATPCEHFKTKAFLNTLS